MLLPWLAAASRLLLHSCGDDGRVGDGRLGGRHQAWREATRHQAANRTQEDIFRETDQNKHNVSRIKFQYSENKVEHLRNKTSDILSQNVS